MAVPDAFLFDLDGTLVDSERETAEAMARALARGQGITVEQFDRDYIIGRSWVAIYDSLKSRYAQLVWTRDELMEQTAVLRDEVFAEMGITVLPGARGLLEWSKQFKRALVTGSSRAEARQVLPLIGPMADFDHVFAAEDVPRSKPDPAGYLMAIAALGVTPAKCIVVEDSVAGIAAGKAAGCFVVACRAGNFGGWDQTGAHVVIDTLTELPTLIDGLATLDPAHYGSQMGTRP